MDCCYSSPHGLSWAAQYVWHGAGTVWQRRKWTGCLTKGKRGENVSKNQQNSINNTKHDLGYFI